MTHSLLFDDALELIDPGGDISTGGYWFEAVAGTSWGNAQPIEVAINSLLRDGALVEWQGDENREVNVVVRIKATDGGALDQGIAALNRATRKRTTLVWTPPDGCADPHVFEVETSNLLAPDDFDDLAWKRNEQVYRLRLVCLPYWRGTTLVTEAAEAIPSVGATVNSCESLTGWTAPAGLVEQSSTEPQSPAPALLAVDSSEHVEGSGSMAVAAYRMWTTVMAATGSSYTPGNEPVGLGYRLCWNEASLSQGISLPSGAYVSFAVKFELPAVVIYDSLAGSTLGEFAVTSTERGTQVVPIGSMIIEALGGGWVRYTWRASDALSITSMRWRGTQYRSTSDTGVRPKMWVDQIAVAETATLGNQVLKTISVRGSARTTGALHIAAPSDSVALGKVLAFTIAQKEVAPGFRPDMSQWVLPGAMTETSGGRPGVFTAIGSTYGSAGSPVLQAPAGLFRAGAYTIAASVRHATGALSFTVEASLLIGSSVVESEELIVDATMEAATWELRTLGTMYLPPTLIASPSADATVRFRFKGGSAPDLEEFYVFPEGGDLTILDCGSGAVGPTASSHCWIDSPSPDQPQGGYWRGATPDRIDAIGIRTVAALTVPGTHSFDPGGMLAFVSSLDAQGPTVSFDYYERNL